MLKSMYECDLRELISFHPTKFHFCNRECVGIRSKQERNFELSDYGCIAGYKFTLRAIISDLPRRPESGDTVFVDGEEYRIIDPVEVDSQCVSVKMHLAGRNSA